MAREYTWLQPYREALFSPASSNIATRILPICFLALREHQETLMLAIDVKDAFLTVSQEQPTRVKCTDASGISISYSLGRVLPGQRDGSLLWHKDLVKFLEGSSLKMAENEAYPSMLRSAKGDCLMLVHIDDILIVGSRKTVLEELIPSMQAKYTISIEIMSGPGDEVTFLKKTHQLMSDGRMIIRIHPKHLDQLCKLLHLSKRLQNKRSPGHSEIETPDTTEELNQHDASVYRSCIGILLYLSPDLPQCQYVIRYLSTCASRPTHKAMVVLKHLIGYMAGHADQYVSLKWKGMHSGLMRDYECEEPVLEIYSDADWAADRNTRRSVSGSGIFFGGCLIYSSSRTQKIVSLSSAESETYAAASAVMDAILIRTILCWVLQIRILMYLYLDSSAARGVLSRRGVGRLRHLSCRVLWLQNLVVEKMLQVKAVLGTINPADVSTKRLSTARLESLMFLFGLWSMSQNQLVGSDDPGRIFRHLPQQASLTSSRNSQLRVLIGALSLLTLQLQGCDAMASEMFEVPYVFTAAWVGLLGAYLLWMSQGRHVKKGTPDSPSFDSDDADTASVMTEATEDTDDFPAFSPEGMISWMFERCNRRFEDAERAGDTVHAQAYNQRRALLADFMNFIGAANDSERDAATEMLNTIDDISSHENSPTKDMDEGEDNRSHRMRYGQLALVNLQGLMATQLQGCSWEESTSSDSSWFTTAFLVTWTMLLVGYSWYMMRRNKDFMYSPPPPTPDTVNRFMAPPVSHENMSLEGLVTWTFVRVRGRLRRATNNGNIGASMRYQQMQRWLEACLHHLPTASLQEKDRMSNSLKEEYDLSDDDNSPSHGLGEVERNFLSTSHGEVYGCIIKLLELQQVEVTMDLLRTFAEIFKEPEVPESDSDEPMNEETRSQRLRRYQNAEQGEVSDPDAWADLHYGEPSGGSANATTDEL